MKKNTLKASPESQNEDLAEQVGAYLGKILKLEKNEAGRWIVGGGYLDKTDLGLYLTVKRIIEEKITE